MGRLRVLVTVLLVALLAACTGSGSSDDDERAVGERPNIVFVLVDDMSLNLMQYLPSLGRMQQEGTTFARYFATDSLCCPSRASIFTGRYPHNTGIYRNVGHDGGYETFKALGLESDTVAIDLQKAGYRTAMMGKYLNQYQPGFPDRPRKVPPGWSEWAVAGYGYNGFDYSLNQTGEVVKYGSAPEDYITDVLSGRAQDFIRRAASDDKPFMIEVAPFMPHAPYIPAPRHANAFEGLTAPRTEAYGATPENAPSWLKPYRLTKADQANMDRDYRLRAQSMLAIDEMITALREQLTESGVADNTYLMFSSDNGYHMGEHSLTNGKTTAFDTDIQVPFVLVGPDVPAGRTVDGLASNIDLRPTFGDLAGAEVPVTVDGQSLAPLWRSEKAVSERKFVLVEHHGPVTDKKDPDFPLPEGGNPPDYEAMRGADWLYVVYRDGEQEYYDLSQDPFQLNNIAGELPAARQKELNQMLRRAEACAGTVACAKAQSAGPE